MLLTAKLEISLHTTGLGGFTQHTAGLGLTLCLCCWQVIDASRLAAALARLADSPEVGAVVLRLNTPGGSALGSDALHHGEQSSMAGVKVPCTLVDTPALLVLGWPPTTGKQ